MKDDFSALDFLSIEGFRMSSLPLDGGKDKKKKKDKKEKKKLKKLQKAVAAMAHAAPGAVGALKAVPKRRLSHLLPRKAAQRAELAKSLQGWPVALSWPRQDVSRFPGENDEIHLS